MDYLFSPLSLSSFSLYLLLVLHLHLSVFLLTSLIYLYSFVFPKYCSWYFISSNTSTPHIDVYDFFTINNFLCCPLISHLIFLLFSCKVSYKIFCCFFYTHIYFIILIRVISYYKYFFFFIFFYYSIYYFIYMSIYFHPLLINYVILYNHSYHVFLIYWI